MAAREVAATFTLGLVIQTQMAAMVKTDWVAAVLEPQATAATVERAARAAMWGHHCEVLL